MLFSIIIVIKKKTEKRSYKKLKPGSPPGRNEKQKIEQNRSKKTYMNLLLLIPPGNNFQCRIDQKINGAINKREKNIPINFPEFPPNKW